MTFTIKSNNAPIRTPVRTRGPLVAVLASLALMGCTHDEVGVQSPNFALVDPAQRHPILVSQKPSTMSVHVPRGSSGLSPKARAEVLDFAARFRGSDAGDSRLVILAPSGSGNEVAAMNAVQQIRGLLTDYGFSDSVVSVEAFEANAESSPAIKVSYMRYVAEGPQCGNWPTNVAYNPQNVPMENTGCANQRNLAAMIANPADLLGPRSVTPRSSDRRDVVFDKYTKGDQTASQKNEDGKVSTRSQGN
jgi:pilus assembly protein CpaD